MSKRIFRASKRSKNNGFLGYALIAVALLLFFAAQNKEQPKESKTEKAFVAEFDTVKVPVPKSSVTQGTAFKDIPIEYIDYPKHQLPKGAVTDVDTIFRSYTTVALPAKLPFFTENFNIAQSNSNRLVSKIPTGMRAITIKVDATAAVEGWARSGSTVDVLLVEDDRTTVVAEEVKILSAERSLEPVDSSRAPEIPSTVTVLVSKEQALAITTAVPRGKISFALRSGDDDARWANRIYTADRLKRAGSNTSKRHVKGYVSIGKSKDKDTSKAFALANGKWIKTKVIPEGYFVNGGKSNEKN